MYRRGKLENGIRIVTEHWPCARSVSLGILVDVGPQDDPPGLGGLAHLSEHALFQGTSGRNAFEISRLMDVAGGQMAAFTARDYTCFYANVLDEYLTYATDLFGDMLLNSVFPTESIEHEKQAVLREIGLSCDTPTERVHQQLKQLMWPNHFLGRSVQGDEDAVGRTTAEDIRAFVGRHYTPDRIIISAAGNLEHDELAEQVQDAFWRLSGAGPSRRKLPCSFNPGLALSESSVSQAYFAIGLPAAAYCAPERYHLFVLNSVLGGGLSSRLFRKLREERGLVYDIASELHTYRDAGAWVIQGSTTPEHLQSVLLLTIMELQRLATFDAAIDEEELWTAKMRVRGQQLLSADNVHLRMSRLATQELYFGRHLPEAEILAEIEAVTLEDLAQTCESHFLPACNHLALSVVGPETSKSFSRSSLEDLFADFGQCAA